MGFLATLLRIIFGSGRGGDTKTYKTKDGGEITSTPRGGRIFTNQEKTRGGGIKTTSWKYRGKTK